MIRQECINSYKGYTLAGGSTFLHIPPHMLLRPYISNYTISFPTPQSMPNEYTILPTASSTLVISANAGKIAKGLRCVNTKASNAGAYANKMDLLLLIEFRPGGLYPFFRADQCELTDSSFTFDELDKELAQTLEDALVTSGYIEALIDTLDRIFITRLCEINTHSINENVSKLLCNIVSRHGDINASKLSAEIYYSEKHIRRLFLRYVGVSPKTFSRIVRVNYALRLMQQRSKRITDVAVQAGYYDQSHFIHDFKQICGLTPQSYIHDMSFFYNDRFKM